MDREQRIQQLTRITEKTRKSAKDLEKQVEKQGIEHWASDDLGRLAGQTAITLEEIQTTIKTIDLAIQYNEEYEENLKSHKETMEEQQSRLKAVSKDLIEELMKRVQDPTPRTTQHSFLRMFQDHNA